MILCLKRPTNLLNKIMLLVRVVVLVRNTPVSYVLMSLNTMSNVDLPIVYICFIASVLINGLSNMKTVLFVGKFCPNRL